MQDQVWNNRNIIRVLLVEDEKSQIELTKLNLTSTDPTFDLTAALTPSEALKLLSLQTFDCIVSDYQMPEMNGIQLCSEIRKTRMIPFIIYTGRGSEEVASAAFAAGVDDYVRKEQNLAHYQVLAKRITHAVERRRIEYLYHISIDENRDGFAIIHGLDFVFANTAMANMLGIQRPEDLMGRSILTWVVGMERDLIRDRTLNRQKGGTEPRLYEYRVKRPDGEVRTLEASVNLIDFMGQPASLVFNHDITERKRIEEALHETQKTFYELVERAPFGIYIVDSQFHISQMNVGSQNGAFRNVRPVIGRDFSEAMRILWPEPVAEGIIASFRHTLETGEPYYSPRFTNPRHDVDTVESYEWELHRMTLPDGQFGVICYYFDSTRLRESEDALRESEERYRSLIEYAPTAIYEVDFIENRFRSVNDGMCRMLGYTEEELLAMNPMEILDPESRQIFLERVRKAQSGETPTSSIEYKARRKDGSEIWGILNVRFRSVEGKIVGAFVVAHDITERKKAEDERRKSEADVKLERDRLSALVNSIQDEVWFADTNRKFTLVNPSALKEFGYEASAPGIDIAEMVLNLEVYRPDGNPRPVEEAPPLRALNGEVIKRQEEMIKTPLGGELRYRAVSAAPVRDVEGKIIGSVSVVRDITEPKRVEDQLRASNEELTASNEELAVTEEKLKVSNEQVQEYVKRLQGLVDVRTEQLGESIGYARSLIEASLDPLVTISRDGMITDVNEATVQVTGITRAELVGSDFSEYFTDPEKARVGYRKVFEEGQVRNYALTIRNRSGRLTDVLYNATVYRDPSGEVAGIFAAARDISERRVLEEQLHRTEVIAAVEQIGATVAHDLRGPLGQIVQSIQVAKKDPTMMPRMLQLAEENAVRSLRMIADWRSSTREIVPQPVKTDLGALVKSVLEGSTLPANVKVVASIGDGLDSVKLDPDIMHRVIDNLVNNAVDAMPSGGKLIVDVKIEADRLIVSVEDTGVGIPEEAKERIWSPLYTTKSGGMGLGLTYSKRAVQAHGGSIDFESQVGKGTTFKVRLPIR